MKRFFISFAFLWFSLLSFAPPSNTEPMFSIGEMFPEYFKTSKLKDLWYATCIVESRNNPYAVNESEGACGIAQIRQIRLDDYNQRTGSKYVLEDCFDPTVAEEIYMYFANLPSYANDFCKIARAWNGSGPKTWEYWDLIKAELDKLNAKYEYA